MNLAVDIGNSRTKLGVFRDGELIHFDRWEHPDLLKLNALIHSQEIRHCILSSVSKDSIDPEKLDNPGLKIVLSHTTPMQVELVYATPETLGRDRIAGIAGAHARFPGKPCLIIDAGSCVTIDLLTGDGKFVGGNIAPGMKMRLRAMHQFTGNLPEIHDPQYEGIMLGNTTRMAMENGAILGMLMEMSGYIEMLKLKFDQLQVILTGGDAEYFAEKLKTQIFVHPNLVLEGLNHILNFNAEKTI